MTWKEQAEPDHEVTEVDIGGTNESQVWPINRVTRRKQKN